MKLRNREIINHNTIKNENTIKKEKFEEEIINQSNVVETNDNFLQLKENIKATTSIINSLCEINLNNIEKQEKISIKILDFLHNISMGETNKETDKRRNKREKIINTITIILFSICLSFVATHISLELSKKLVKNIFIIPSTILDILIYNTIGLFTDYNNYLTNKIETFSLSPSIKELEYIIYFFVCYILSLINYSIITVLRFATNISNGDISMCVSPINFKYPPQNIVFNKEIIKVKDIYNIIDEVYGRRNRENIISNSICYKK
jgi:hypothetical protein